MAGTVSDPSPVFSAAESPGSTPATGTPVGDLFRLHGAAAAELVKLLDAKLAPIQAQLAALTSSGPGQGSGAAAATMGDAPAQVAAVTLGDVPVKPAATQLEEATQTTVAEDGSQTLQNEPSTQPAGPSLLLLDQLRGMARTLEDGEFAAAVRSVVERAAPY